MDSLSDSDGMQSENKKIADYRPSFTNQWNMADPTNNNIRQRAHVSSRQGQPPQTRKISAWKRARDLPAFLDASASVSQ